MKRITVMAILLVLCACTLTVNNLKFELEGGNFGFILPTSTNTPTPTFTPVFQRYVLITAGNINLRQTPSTLLPRIAVIPTNTSALVLEERNGWLYIRYGTPSSFTEGWVLGSLASAPITVTTTPLPTPTVVAPTPTREVFPTLIIPGEGLLGYTQPSLTTSRAGLRLMPSDRYIIIGFNEEFVPPANTRYWYFVCIYTSDNTGDCKQVMWVSP